METPIPSFLGNLTGQHMETAGSTVSVPAVASRTAGTPNGTASWSRPWPIGSPPSTGTPRSPRRSRKHLRDGDRPVVGAIGELAYCHARDAARGRRRGAGAAAFGPLCTVARPRPRAAAPRPAGRACRVCRCVAVSRHRFPPRSGPRAVPGIRTAEVSSSGRALSSTGSAVMTVRRKASAASGPVRWSSQAAPGPCTVASRAPRHNASCSAVMSEKPTTSLGSARTASRSTPSTMR